MVSLTIVRASNARLRDHGPGLVAVFVGGTTGIGESTLKAFVVNTVQPKVYIIGRNEEASSRIISESKKLNADSKLAFIKCDISLLANSMQACATIKAQEKHINLLVFTSGGFEISGREETVEGLDRKIALKFYSRFFFVHTLLPLLTAAGQHSGLARVISVCGAGKESAIDESDLELKKPGSYSMPRHFALTIIMNDFACEELARANPFISFVHYFPGYVQTSQVPTINGVGKFLEWFLKLVEFLATPLAVPLGESGERTLYNATAKEFEPKGSDGKAIEDLAVGSDGVRGSGAYLVNYDGTVTGKQNILKPMRERGFGKKAWDHALEVFERVVKE